MKDIWKIAKWEITRNLTNKQFIIGLLLTPVMMALFGGVPLLLEKWNQPTITTYYVVDDLNALESVQMLLPDNIQLQEADDSSTVAKTVQETKASGFFHLDSDFLASGEIDLVYNDRNSGGLNAVQRALTSFLQQTRLAGSEIDPEQLAFVTATAQVRQVPLEEELEPKTMHMIVSGVFTFLVFFLIITSGTMLMQSALQEKRDRMAEVVLSSIRPGKLMQGKILGHFVLGIIQLGFWLAIGLPVAKYFLDFPILEALAAVNLPIILFYGLGGYLLFSSLFVSIGSTMEDLQSASNSQGLVVMLPMLSFLFLGPVISNPDGTVALFASLFPFTSPAIMTLRSGLTTVPLWQNLVAGGLLLIATWVTIVMAAKIFRIGMLMYGKNATIQEIFKWLRYKEN